MQGCNTSRAPRVAILQEEQIATRPVHFGTFSSTAATQPKLALPLRVIYDVEFRNREVAILNSLYGASGCTPPII